MKTIEFKALPDETTPLNPTNLNKMQSNVKDVFDGQNAMGSIVVENIECKNLFDGALELGTINNTTGQNEVDNMVIRSKHFIEVKFNTVYTLSNYINASNFVFEYDANYNFIKYSSNTEQSYTFTTTQTTKYIRFRTKQSENITNLTTPFQLEKGNIATQFVEHKDFINPFIENLTNKFAINSENVEFSNTYSSKIFRCGNIVHINLFLTLKNPTSAEFSNLVLGKLDDSIIPKTSIIDRCSIGSHQYAGWSFDIADGQVNINSQKNIVISSFESTTKLKKYIAINIMYLV